MSYADRALARHQAAVKCGCGGLEHPEHEIDDLFLDALQAQLGASYFVDGGEDA